MRMRMKRFKTGAWVVAALTATILAVGTSPAAASGTYSGRAYVYGAGLYVDDWDNEGVVDRDTNRVSNATCLWQKVLWADGFLPLSGVDGVFGDGTYNATRAWQRAQTGLADDGSAGKASWHVAGFSVWLYGSDAAGATMTGQYRGDYAYFDIKRDTDGNYQFIDGDGAWRKAGYDYRTCS
ncbi:peptidoglycan-binding protein [Streptomyces sp. NPDC051940]|uniref:peptidoglycan-binding domain-containing protein n=1 Tax=Streptomyces sp. NPDC051940 TaxID=3155675 RepID=UPI00344047A2